MDVLSRLSLILSWRLVTSDIPNTWNVAPFVAISKGSNEIMVQPTQILLLIGFAIIRSSDTIESPIIVVVISMPLSCLVSLFIDSASTLHWSRSPCPSL